jgi:hypothetical protein
LLFTDRHALQLLDQTFAKNTKINGLGGNLTKRNNRVFVVITIDRWQIPFENSACTLPSRQHKVKPVWDFLDAIFNGNACHEYLLVLIDQMAKSSKDAAIFRQRQTR